MAFVAYSGDFDLDDDGILRDSTELEEEHWTDYIFDKKPGGILIDDDGIVRDDLDNLSKHGSSTHWTDSGLGVDKPASTPSTLRQLDLQSYPSFEDVSRNLDDSNVNISDLEASRDDISFDDGDKEYLGDQSRDFGRDNRSGLSSRSSFDHSLNYDDTLDNTKDEPKHKEELFSEEYYRQLQELGVLVDESDFAKPRDSLQEFETLEGNYSRDYDDEESKVDIAIEEFLRHDVNTPTRDSMDLAKPDINVQRNRPSYLDDSHGFDQFDQREFEVNDVGKRTRPNTASSTRTISSRSFPEISPEEALELYTAKLQNMDDESESSSIQFEQSQSQRLTQASEMDDEIFFDPSQERDDESPKPPKMPAYDDEDRPSHTLKSKSRSDKLSDRSRSVTPQGQGYSYIEEDSDGSRSATPQPDEGFDRHENTSRNGYQSNEDRADSLTQVSRLDSRNKTYSDSDTFRPESALSEMSSAASESRSARPKSVSNTQNKKPPKDQQKSSLSHARSQESFFDINQDGSPKKVEKGPKRLLPKPSSNDISQSFKVKSKSVTNIAALGPVKPTHMSLSEIHNIYIDDPDTDLPDPSDPKSTASDVPKGELTQKLKQEANRRQQATHLVKQLQSDYDKLLSKYALAELTIDQMRLGAKISIHANSPTPSQATSGSIQSAQHLHMIQLAGAQQGHMARSPQQGTPNIFFPENATSVTHMGTGQDSNDGRMPRGMSPAIIQRSESTHSMDSTSTPRGDVEEQGGIANEAEKVKFGLLFQARNLDERMQSFQSLLGVEQLTVKEQENVFEQIRTDHEKLRRVYLQSKEDYNVLKRSSAAIGTEVNFDQEKELEGELFKLGMKFDEIHEKVDENLKEKSSTRQPFQSKRKDSISSTQSSTNEPDPSTENMKKKMHGVKAGDDLLQPRFEQGFEDKLNRVHEEYNALMDRYRRLKQMGQSRERDKEIDQLVKKLTIICDEEPEVFRLPQEIQDRVDQMSAKKEAKLESKRHANSRADLKSGTINKSKSSSSSTEKRKLPSPKKTPQPAKSYEIMSALSGSESWSLAESIDRWERSKMPEDQDGKHRSKSRENLNSSITSTRSFRQDEENGARNRDSYGDEPHLQRRDRAGSYNSLSTRGRHTPDSSYNDRDSPVPSLPRPRRHDYPERERRERRSADSSDLKKFPDSLKASTSSLATDSGMSSLYSPKRRFKRPDAGSTNSLQDSGISEHEGGATGTSGPNSPLSKLPGPGKFKQMTGRREADTDSGFIGSMVGSEVSAGNLSSRRQPPQSPLRLRHPGDSPTNQHQRPSSRNSTRSDDSIRAATPRSARSIASSKSSRRTPTKAFPLPETSTNQSKSASEVRAKTPTRPDSKTRQRDQATRSREYTDDSYTTVTESELSFESDMQPRRIRPSSRNSMNNTSLRQIDKIAEDSEGEQYTVDPSLNETTDINLSWISQSERSEKPTIQDSRKRDKVPSVVSKTQQRPSSVSKTKQPMNNQKQAQGQSQGQTRSKQGRSSRSSRQMSEDDSSMTVSPTRDTTRDLTGDTTQDTYTSDETTPRSVIERQRKSGRDKTSPRVTEVKTPKPPSPETAPPRAVTPIKVQRSEVHPSLLYEQPQRGPVVTAPQLQRSGIPEVYLTKEVGSGSEDTILASDAETAATRGSINSERLKLLTDEIGKLKEEFHRASQEKQAQPPPAPLPPQPPQDQYYDQYFDPTEDPYAFMRGPRRRANSFSGHGEKQYDFDWMYPSNQDRDMPLGYAAAESYATPRTPKRNKEETEKESRGRHRLRQKINQRNSGTQHYAEQNGYESDQSPTRGRVEEMQPTSARLKGNFGYYSPQTMEVPETVRSQGHTIQPPGYQTQSGRRVFGSQPNLTFTGYQPPPPKAPRSTASGHSTRSSSGTQPSQTRPLRQTLYSYAANPHRNRPHSIHGDLPNQHLHQTHYANDDIHINDGRTRFVPSGANDVYSEGGVNSNYGVYTDTCPLCGSTSYHTHGEYVFPPEDHQAPIGYLVQNGRDLLQNLRVPIYIQPLQSPPATVNIMNPVLPQYPLLPPPQPQIPIYQPFVDMGNNQPHVQAPQVHFEPPPLSLNPPLPPPQIYSRPKSDQGHRKSSLSRSQSFRISNTSKEKHFSRQNPLRASLPIRVYKTPPPIKPQLFPVNIPIQAKPIKRSHSLKLEPMAVLPDGTHQPIIIDGHTTIRDGGPGVRGRSRSSGRTGQVRHYSPDGRARSRYFVRQFGGEESESAESEVEEVQRRRSRSVGRRRTIKHGRKYRRVRGEDYESEGPALKTSETEPPKVQENKPEDKGENSEKKDSAAAEADLNRSLRLVGEIDELTNKMMTTVGDELKSQSRRKKEFGSSLW